MPDAQGFSGHAHNYPVNPANSISFLVIASLLQAGSLSSVASVILIPRNEGELNSAAKRDII